ncbi:hypothetical protein ACFV1B_27965, partial [Streptomyces sp. NPDC059637]
MLADSGVELSDEELLDVLWLARGLPQREQAPLEVISFGESAVADEGAGDAGEGEEVLGFAFV